MLHAFASSPATITRPSSVPLGAADPHRFEGIRHAALLIADDDSQETELIRVCLLADGFHNLCFVGSGLEVVPRAKEFHPDLILLGMDLQGRSGLETLQAIRAYPELTATPVVVTAEIASDAKLELLRHGATDLLPKPLHQAELLARTRHVLAAKLYQNRLLQYSQELEEAVRKRTADLELARREFVQCLARAAELRDDDTGHHILRVGRYARVIGEELGLPSKVLDVLEQAAQLHDIGKIGIPDRVLLKPGKLTPAEFDLIQKHCGYGSRIMEGRVFENMLEREPGDVRDHTQWESKIMDMGSSPFLSVAKRIALTHHEWWDGTGYPLGLAREDIPFEGRITAVADAFDALSCKRPYKPAFPLERCFRILEEGRGKQFDPAVIDAFFVRRQEITQIQIDLADMG